MGFPSISNFLADLGSCSAQANTYIATLPNADYKFGLLHASCEFVALSAFIRADPSSSDGLGATVVPLAATAFASNGIRFTYFYAISLGLALVNLAVLLNAFRFNYRILDVEPSPDSGSDEEAIEMGAVGDSKSAIGQPPVAAPAVLPKKSNGRFIETLKNRSVVLWMVFIFVSSS